MKRVAVTGGAGFIGSHLIDNLLKRGNKVLCIDNLITGNRENIKHHMNNENFEFIYYDVSKPFYTDIKIDFIFHFASPASPIDYQKYPIQTLKVGGLGTHNMLGLCKEHEAGFLLASTSEVYGDPLIHPQTEDYWGNVNPIGPRGVYDEAKRFAEAITMAYYRYHGLDTRIVRIFNTFGPRMRKNDGRVVPAFINQALLNNPLTVFGNGSQTRSFCFVQDLVEGLLTFMETDEHYPINLGNPKEMTVLEFAEIVIKLTGSQSDIIFQKLPVDDPKIRQPNIARAQEFLNWKPKVTLEEGLKKTIEYFKEKL
ncbi:SDR family oxidoreductase [Candidatus Dependentiae bacterium]|nr:SDR family oxidoreductase [Candidatus Dependentiae bacterium]